jgi:hypothetical protein
MSGNAPTSGENSSGNASREPQPQQIWVVAREHLPQASIETEGRARQRRLGDPKDRQVYFSGVDWRDAELKVKPGAAHPGKVFEVADQDDSDACAGFAVAHALRANIAIHRHEDIGLVSPFLVWGLAREQEPRLRDGRSQLLHDALLVVNNYGIPNAAVGDRERAMRGGLTTHIQQIALDFHLADGGREANGRKIQGVVDLGYFLGDYAAWLHAFGPIAVHMVVNPESFSRIGPDRPLVDYIPGQAFDGELSTKYAGHDVAVVGYLPHDPSNPLSDSFIIMNSYGPRWGRDGFAYVKFETAQQCFRAGYGLLLREHLGYRWGGIAGAQVTSRLAIAHAPPPEVAGCPRPERSHQP